MVALHYYLTLQPFGCNVVEQVYINNLAFYILCAMSLFICFSTASLLSFTVSDIFYHAIEIFPFPKSF